MSYPTHAQYFPVYKKSQAAKKSKKASKPAKPKDNTSAEEAGDGEQDPMEDDSVTAPPEESTADLSAPEADNSNTVTEGQETTT